MGGSGARTMVRVIAIGNEAAGDDGAGLAAVRRARPDLERIPGVEVVEAGAAFRVLDLLGGTAAALVVDAVRTPGGGRAAGDVIRAEAGPHGLPAEIGSSISSHGFGLAEAVGLGAAMDGAPRVVFLGVEAAATEAGEPFSPEVARAIPGLADRVVEEAARLAGGVGDG